MFAENLKSVRIAKGLTQDELAIRLNVVRHTVSKWEKGQSVPDAEMLIKIAEVFDISVKVLLDEKIENKTNRNAIPEQLPRINEQFTAKTRRVKFVLKFMLGIMIGIILTYMLLRIG